MIKKIVFLFIIIISLIIIYGLIDQITQALQASKRLDTAASELSRLQKENYLLTEKLSKVESIDFIEHQLRNKLNLAKPNETIVIIPKEDLAKILGADAKAVEVPVPNWLGWLNLFI